MWNKCAHKCEHQSLNENQDQCDKYMFLNHSAVEDLTLISADQFSITSTI